MPYKEIGGKKVFAKDFIFPSFLFSHIIQSETDASNSNKQK